VRSLPAAGFWRNRSGIWGGGRHLPTGTVRAGLGRRPHSPAKLVIKPVETSAPASRTRTITQFPSGLQTAPGRAQTEESSRTTFRVYCPNLTGWRQRCGWPELGQPTRRLKKVGNETPHPRRNPAQGLSQSMGRRFRHHRPKSRGQPICPTCRLLNPWVRLERSRRAAFPA